MKTYFDLTKEEIEQRSKLTSVEQLLVSDFLKAAAALPKSLCIKIDKYSPHLSVMKRITKGSAKRVASLKKRSLMF